MSEGEAGAAAVHPVRTTVEATAAEFAAEPDVTAAPDHDDHLTGELLG